MPHVTDPTVIATTGANPERRTAIKQLAVMCGLVLSANSLSLMADSFSSPRDSTRRKKRLLNPAQLVLVRELGELIIPTTDTPGAIAADVHNFIDYQAAYCFNSAEQHALLGGLQKIDSSAQALYDKAFLLCEKNQQVELLNHMEKAQGDFTAEDRKAFKQLKALVLFGYYTSEIGATKELGYQAVPGGYKGSLKFSTLGKAWALN